MLGRCIDQMLCIVAVQKDEIEIQREQAPTEEELPRTEEKPEEAKPEPKDEPTPTQPADQAPEEGITPVAPEFTELLQNKKVRDGERVVLKVKFRGTPAPKITWYQKGQELQPSTDFQITVDYSKQESILIIVEVFPEDEGEYTCIAVNDFGESITTCKVTVICKYKCLCL